jgi:hypothetical protein
LLLHLQHPKTQGIQFMVRKIRVSTRADLFEQRKQEYLTAGYKIEDEQPVPVRGMCSFTVVIPAQQESGSESE